MTVHADDEYRLYGSAFALTHAGRVREENQDNFFLNEHAGVFAVMDGAGGMRDGSVASGLIKQNLSKIASPTSAEQLLQNFEGCVIEAKAHIDEVSQRQHGADMGSTIAAILVYGIDFACVWAGDSRVYRLRDGQMEQISTDHTEVQDLIDRSLLTVEEARTWTRRHVITRAVGSGLELEMELVSGKLKEGDRFLLCSDGLTEHVKDPELERHLKSGAKQLIAQNLINAALEDGGRDNVTVVIVDIGRDDRSVQETMA